VPQFHSLRQTLRALIDCSSTPITHLRLQHISAEDMKDTFERFLLVESLDLSIQEDSNDLNLTMNELAWKMLPHNSPESDVLLTIWGTSVGVLSFNMIYIIYGDHYFCKVLNQGYFVGPILEDAPQTTVPVLVNGFGLMLLYQIGEHDHRGYSLTSRHPFHLV